LIQYVVMNYFLKSAIVCLIFQCTSSFAAPFVRQPNLEHGQNGFFPAIAAVGSIINFAIRLGVPLPKVDSRVCRASEIARHVLGQKKVTTGTDCNEQSDVDPTGSIAPIIPVALKSHQSMMTGGGVRSGNDAGRGDSQASGGGTTEPEPDDAKRKRPATPPNGSQLPAQPPFPAGSLHFPAPGYVIDSTDQQLYWMSRGPNFPLALYRVDTATGNFFAVCPMYSSSSGNIVDCRADLRFCIFDVGLTSPEGTVILRNRLDFSASAWSRTDRAYMPVLAMQNEALAARPALAPSRVVPALGYTYNHYPLMPLFWVSGVLVRYENGHPQKCCPISPDDNSCVNLNNEYAYYQIDEGKQSSFRTVILRDQNGHPIAFNKKTGFFEFVVFTDPNDPESMYTFNGKKCRWEFRNGYEILWAPHDDPSKPSIPVTPNKVGDQGIAFPTQANLVYVRNDVSRQSAFATVVLRDANGNAWAWNPSTQAFAKDPTQPPLPRKRDS
jgi:hypothetical protein